jgi:sterol desaturase/sphingolipid hydroxylase (fatty acid hydroxylase superfamily)
VDLIALAIPFFLLALLLELAVDRYRGSGLYRANDAINSLSAGTLSTTFGYFTRLLPALMWGIVLQHLAIIDVDLALFDVSMRGLVLWTLAMIAFDLCYYWAHRMGHEISVLWAAHAVHHQSEDYNLSTALRQTSTGFLFSWIFYVPLFVLGMPIEVFVTVNALNLIYQFWVHTQLVGKLGWLDRVFVTPSNHRVHHAQNEAYIDRNYGGIFILWDRLFGTFQEEIDDEPVVYGVRKPLASWNPFWANLQVYSYLWFDARRTSRWRDKLGIWFQRTGWRPADVEARYPKKPAHLESFRKFDPELLPGQRRYILLQFVLAAFGVLWIGSLFAEQGATAVFLPCALLWLTLYSLGLLSEQRPNAVRLELMRLLAIMPLGLLALVRQDLVEGAMIVWVVLASYVAISIVGLQIANGKRSATRRAA